jgi:Tfp pilus assembly protein PilN
MRAVNLLPRDATKSRGISKQQLPAVVGAGVGVVVLAALAGGYLSASSKVASAQNDLNAAKAQLAATPLPPQPDTQSQTTPGAVVSEQAPRLQAVSSALSQRIAWDRILREFSLVLPNDVWISSLTMSAPIGNASNGFSINATTYSYASVARMLSRMSLIPDLKSVSLGSTAKRGRVVEFAVSAAVKGGAPAPSPVPAATPRPSSETTTTAGEEAAR